MRQRQYIVLSALALFVLFTLSVRRLSYHDAPPQPDRRPTREPQPIPVVERPRPSSAPRPQEPADTATHPIRYLVGQARRDLELVRARQSKTLVEAVAEYRRRYALPPPPHFDKWFAFAQRNKVQLVDEFDTVHDLIMPFWGLKPRTVRARAREALGSDNMLLGLAIRNHSVSHAQGGPDWQRNATEGMMAKFLDYLPDMDLAFNVHDEPRVMVPHDDLARLLHKARAQTIPAAAARRRPTNAFSPRAPDLNDGRAFDETKLTRFNTFAHQATWTHSRMSCPPESPARILEEDDRVDDVSKYGFSRLGLVYNTTAMSDICLSPSLSDSYGFFDRPNAYSIVHDLFPVFSQSKISSYNDIIYPSPWYWHQKVAYDESQDRSWDRKQDKLYWRGSTTGGFSRGGGWRRQHRQHLVQKINAGDQALVMENVGSAADPLWQAKEVPRGDYRGLMDVSFSGIGQCDPGDCEAQAQFFDIKRHAKQRNAWKFKYLLDIDGNAFSGRFYAFLRSWSLTFKLAVFREWHGEWLKPWVHYVPLSLQGDDWLEAVRFFSNGSLSDGEAEKMAVDGREWANMVLRNEDMEAWLFRLLLEYGRVVDDDRENIGFDLGGASNENAY